MLANQPGFAAPHTPRPGLQERRARPVLPLVGSHKASSNPKGGRRPRPRTDKGPVDDLRAPGRGQPPPGYRDAYSEFLHRLAADKDKK